MGKLQTRLLSAICAALVFLACFAAVVPQKVYALTATKNTQDFIQYLGGMPSYQPSGETLYISIGGTVYGVDSTVLTASMLQAELVGSYLGEPCEPSAVYKEAYKAQVVAAYSFVKYANNRGSAVSSGQIAFRKPHAGTVRLAEQVAGQYVSYNGQVAQTFYTASAGLHTQSNQYAWGGTAVPYLQGKACKYDEEAVTKTYTKSQMETILKNNGFSPSGDPSGWFRITQSYDDGYIYAITICGKAKDGDFLKDMLSLRSYKATVTYHASQQQFTVVTKGYGHGVGMSQIGAQGYAKNEGWNYQQILTFYYTGTTVQGGRTPSPVTTGDVNQDGTVDVLDLVAVQNHILGKTMLTGNALKAADANGDGSVDVLDMVKIQNMILGKG